MIYLDLFFGFLTVGCFAFGGAYGAIPLIQEVVLSYGWLSAETMAYMIAVSESTPGPIMVNLSTYVGFTQAGLPGALLASLAVILPSFIVILLVAMFMSTALKNRYIQALLRGIKPCVVGIVLATGLVMLVRGVLPNGALDWISLGITAALALIFKGYPHFTGKKLSPIVFLSVAACLGTLIFGIL